jgi:hypothetical protein
MYLTFQYKDILFAVKIEKIKYEKEVKVSGHGYLKGI